MLYIYVIYICYIYMLYIYVIYIYVIHICILLYIHEEEKVTYLLIYQLKDRGGGDKGIIRHVSLECVFLDGSPMLRHPYYFYIFMSLNQPLHSNIICSCLTDCRKVLIFIVICTNYEFIS